MSEKCLIQIPDSAAKRKILSLFEDFLRRHLSNFFQKQVLCLLGKTAFELGTYQNLNIRPENIWSIERHESTCYHQVSTGNFQKINIFKGDLSRFPDFMMQINPEKYFDIINIDLCGNYRTYLNDLSNLMPLLLKSDSRVLGIVSFIGHDRDLNYHGQLTANYIRLALNGKPIFWKLINKIEMENEVIHNLIKSSSKKMYNLWRELGFFWWLINQLANYSYHPENKIITIDSNNQQLICSATEIIKNRFDQKFDNDSITYIQDFQFGKFFKNIKLWFWPTIIERYNYISKTSRFFVWFLKIGRANSSDECRNFQEILEETLQNVVDFQFSLFNAQGNRITIE